MRHVRSTRTLLLAAGSALSLSIAAPALAQTALAQAGPVPAGPSTDAPVATAQQPDTSGSSNTAGSTQVPIQSNPTSAAGAPNSQTVTTAGGDNTVHEITVLGVRGAQQAAIREKQLAPQIVDSIVAEDIGKLPDNTIADSLQRVPGVEITRDAGEGSGVNIRGVPQVLTTLNGEIFLGGGGSTVAVGGDGQSFGGGALTSAQPTLSDVPPALFAGVDVIKSPQASDLSGGIGGILALKTRRPLDLQRGLTLTGSAQGDYAFVSDNANQSYSGLIGWNNDGKFGALFAFSYTDETLANYHVNDGYSILPVTSSDLGFPVRPTAGPQTNSTAFGSNDYYYQPVYYAFNNSTIDRQRLGLSSSFQYKILPGLVATVDLDYLHYDNRDSIQEMQVNTNNALNVLQPGATISSDGALLNGTYDLPHYQMHAENDFTHSDAGDTSFQLAYNNGGRFRGSIRYVGDAALQQTSNAFGDSIATQYVDTAHSGIITPTSNGLPTRVNQNGLPGPVVVSVQPNASYPQAQLITDVTNPANYQLQSSWANGSQTVAQINVGRADGSYDVNFGPLRTIDFGARYSDRSIKYTQFNYLSLEGGSGPNNEYYFHDSLISDTNFPTGNANIPGVSIIHQYPYSTLPAGYVSSVKIKGVNVALPDINTKVMNNAVAYLDSIYPGERPFEDPTQSYSVDEKETSGYIQADYASHLPFLGLPYSGNFGLRIVNTRLGITNFITNGADFIGSTGSYNGVLDNLGENHFTNDYTDVLPQFNVSFDVTDTQKFRLAVNKAVARQDLGALGPGFSASYEANNGRNPSLPNATQLFLQANSGNPDLQPFRSTNWQGSYEWYFHKGSLLSLAAFYIDVASFPLQQTVQEPEPDGDGVVRAGGPVTTTVNGGGASIKGLEAAYQQAFDFLPGIFSGLGTNINFTYSDSQTDNVDSTGQRELLPNNSKYQVNGILYYQKGPWQGRVAYNWRSTEFVQAYGIGSGTEAQNLGIYAKPIGFMDASISYDVNRHLTVYAQATNITQSNQQRYLEFPDVFYDENQYETRLFFGVRLRN